MKKRVLISIIFFLFFHVCYPQSDFKFYDEVTLPQTDAWNFIRQGDIAPSMYTGTLNVSVPIYEFRDNDFHIPLVALLPHKLSF